MNLTTLAGIGAGVAAFWSSIRAWLDTLLSVVWVRAVVEHPASMHLLAYLDEHYRRSALGTPVLNARQAYVRPRQRRQWIATREPGVREVFWNGLGFLVVGAGHGTETTAIFHRNVSVGYVRGAFDIAALLVKAVEARNAHVDTAVRSDRYRVRRHYGMSAFGTRGNMDQVAPGPPSSTEGDEDVDRLRPIGWEREDIGEPTNKSPFSGLIYADEINTLRARVRVWFQAEAWCRERLIPWRMGALLYGPPGTGKTSFARAIAQDLGIPIHVIDLSAMDNRELWGAWSDAVGDAPCVVLIEDLDRVFHRSENIVRDSNLTFDALLNCISGVEVSDGVLTLVTANDPQALDPAIGIPGGNGTSTRPGRLDVQVHFGPMTPEERERLAILITGDDAGGARIASETSGMTGAQVQAVCAEIALSRMFRGELPG